MNPRVCESCGGDYTPKVASQKTCSAACRRDMQRAYFREFKRSRRVEKPPRPPVKCEVCGGYFTPDRKTAKVCPNAECKAEYKRRLEAARNSGNPVGSGCVNLTCVECGGPFTGHVNSLVCSHGCLMKRRRRLGRGDKVWMCIGCGNKFVPNGNDRYTCSQACRRAALARKNARLAAPRMARAIEVRATRRATDPEYAARLREIDRNSRARRAARKAELDLLRLRTHVEGTIRGTTDHDRPGTGGDVDG